MKDYTLILKQLNEAGNLRSLPDIVHTGNRIERDRQVMLNLSSNDYLGLASRSDLREAFFEEWKEKDYPLSSSSSRLLTGNFTVYTELEQLMAERFNREAALLFNSGYHANTGILPALADKQTLILADKLVHASIIDGILLSGAPFQRYRHNDYNQLETLLKKNAGQYEQLFIVTESIFSMDGDVADLRRLVELKKSYPNVCLYVDEAHAIGVRGKNGLGIAEEQDCIREIDLLVGTFGKALASMGAYVVCSRTIREYLVNCMRPLIFSTALPPAQIAWTRFIFERLPEFSSLREELTLTSHLLSDALEGKGGEISESHIIPYIIRENNDCISKAEELQRKGFYCLPVRPPTVPKGMARIRFSLTADITTEQLTQLIKEI
ncbi:8-amino-7-oxononanoate synthase [Parabacteroides goldsteinii]|mgnify:CR=1 FL=1|jgi:8-amino-7-oxononanoate synthase|uniref:8-amino-7-oxononanoate synthase n=1 Tax=Parabacteroides goldsteinii TaxID=328812 RepID=UPI001D26CACC|nr:8-amino-7-oxononanoate synthase [Parabacteroides goldsteinii]MBS6574639.1 8-amino-7-oxononanoate synthase [Parabacteroides goldsteinii]